jgi:hypothetical protein
MLKNRALSDAPRLRKPSAMFAAIDTAARLNWDVKPNISCFGNAPVNL